jgi:hypothetical protein
MEVKAHIHFVRERERECYAQECLPRVTTTQNFQGRIFSVPLVWVYDAIRFYLIFRGLILRVLNFSIKWTNFYFAELFIY